MLMELWDRYRRILLGIAVLTFAALSFYLYSSFGEDRLQELPLSQPQYPMDQPAAIIDATEAPMQPSSALALPKAASKKERTMYIDVKGQVKRPGIYPFFDNERVADAIEKAGGFLPNADTLQVNLAQHLADGMYIIVPTKGAKPNDNYPLPVIATGTAAPQTNGRTTAANSSPINLNTATVEQLATLPGIGKTRAEAILAYREQHGKFTQTDQLARITGIGKKIVERLKDKISVD